ncbi:MAG TPA: FoF1 ATP synthase subunit gamma [Gemmataceae bacterium]|nr:FoF1 ATP synthase subunit gamma [Gemmataceae bacterium]
MSREQTQRRRQAVGGIHDIVSAMRAIAAGRIQGAQRALASARRYEVVVHRALAAVAAGSGVRSLPDVAGRTPTLLVMTSEQPLCGAFNQNVLALAERRWHELRGDGPVRLVAVGQRGLHQLAARGILPDGTEPAATALGGLRDLVKRLAVAVGQRFAAGEQGALHVVYSRYRSISEQAPTEERLLPLDLTQFLPASVRPAPRYHRYLPASGLLAGLVTEHAFINLYRIAADSFASEQASRLVAMDGATRNTEKLLETLLDLERRERQGEITRQVLELIAARFAAE